VAKASNFGMDLVEDRLDVTRYRRISREIYGDAEIVLTSITG